MAADGDTQSETKLGDADDDESFDNLEKETQNLTETSVSDIIEDASKIKTPSIEEENIDKTHESDEIQKTPATMPKVFADEILKNDDEISERATTYDEEEKSSETLNENNNNGEERFRVDRKKLENLIKDEETNPNGEPFFHKIENATNTKISWPPKLKIGAKSKKDPYIKVAGLPEDRQAAKQMVLSVMDTKSARVTLKMDVSFADHSHIIGKGGHTINAVMKSTQCHIHFPDSNRTSSEKSNQVSIAGPPYCVESARRQIRELLPIVLKFEIPPSAVTVPDSSSPVIVNIAQTYKVTISFQQQLRSYGFIGCVKGLHADPFSVRDAILKILEHLTGTVPVTVPVTTQIEIDSKHHIFVSGRNANNINKIRQATGACIQFPDPHDPSTRKSTVTITGTIESAVTAKVYLLQYLPLILMFDIRDGENEGMLEQGMLNHLMEKSDVNITVKPKPRQLCKSIIIKGHEKNAHNIYKTRLHLIGENSANMPYLMTPLATLVIPPTNNPIHLLPVANNQMISQVPHHQPPPSVVTCMSSSQSSPLSPPVESSSPLERQQSPENSGSPKANPPSAYLRVSPVGQRIIGSEMKMKRLSVDALLGNVLEEKDLIENEKKRASSSENLSVSRNGEAMLNHLQSSQSDLTEHMNKEIQLALSGSFNQPPNSTTLAPPASHASVDSGLSQSQEDMNNLSMTHDIMDNVGLQRNNVFGVEEYELRKQMAKNAMHSQVSGKVRTPTNAWSGLGFSNSMPEAVIKELWNNREKRSAQRTSGLQNNQHSPTTSLDSSVSSNGSSTSHGLGHQSPAANKAVRPPPGLEDSHPSMSNSFLSNNFDYNSVLSPQLDHMNHSNNNSMYSGINCIADLFTKLGLEQYIEAFEKEEVDLSTFLSLTDDDLKELGVVTFGARKKMANAMKDLQGGQQISSYSNISQPHIPSTLSNGLYPNVRPTAHTLDIAAHSLRW